MKRRAMYFNDARHFYLYALEPPMSLEDAWRPVDELAGTPVDTLIYGVETAGLFSDTKVGVRAGADQRPFTSAHAWRAWYNMQSLIDRGLDPLRVLIDRAHDRGLAFITSLRMGGGPRGEAHRIGVPGPTAGGGGPRQNNPDFGRPEVRALRAAWLEELAGYPVEGIELDFAFTPFYFRPDEIAANTPVMTAYVGQLAAMVRSRGRDRVVGARVFPTPELNLALGLDVAAWLREGLVDYVAPMFYGFHQLDPNLPIEDLAGLAHAAGATVYPVIQPHYIESGSQATPAMLRAALANYWDRGADGMIVAPWFHWPFGDAERAFLSEIGDPVAIAGKDRHHVVAHRQPEAAALGYDQPLPLALERADPAVRREVRFWVADPGRRPGRMRLLLRVLNLVTADDLRVDLNGAPPGSLRRTSHRYEHQWLEYTLEAAPRRGENVLALGLAARPAGLEGGVTVDRVELLVEQDRPRAVDDRPPGL